MKQTPPQTGVFNRNPKMLLSPIRESFHDEEHTPRSLFYSVTVDRSVPSSSSSTASTTSSQSALKSTPKQYLPVALVVVSLTSEYIASDFQEPIELALILYMTYMFLEWPWKWHNQVTHVLSTVPESHFAHRQRLYNRQRQALALIFINTFTTSFCMYAGRQKLSSRYTSINQSNVLIFIGCLVYRTMLKWAQRMEESTHEFQPAPVVREVRDTRLEEMNREINRLRFELRQLHTDFKSQVQESTQMSTPQEVVKQEPLLWSLPQRIIGASFILVLRFLRFLTSN